MNLFRDHLTEGRGPRFAPQMHTINSALHTALGMCRSAVSQGEYKQFVSSTKLADWREDWVRASKLVLISRLDDTLGSGVCFDLDVVDFAFRNVLCSYENELRRVDVERKAQLRHMDGVWDEVLASKEEHYSGSPYILGELIVIFAASRRAFEANSDKAKAAVPVVESDKAQAAVPLVEIDNAQGDVFVAEMEGTRASLQGVIPPPEIRVPETLHDAFQELPDESLLPTAGESLDGSVDGWDFLLEGLANHVPGARPPLPLMRRRADVALGMRSAPPTGAGSAEPQAKRRRKGS